jgi:mercuric ion transport protein
MNTLRRLLPSGLGGLTGLACALCCIVPLLLAAGVLGGAGWAYLGQIMPGIALALAAATGLAWWWARRRTHRPSCGGGACSCAQPS